MKEFKKGQPVVHFMSYDRKGTWTFTRATVQSCGEKQMTLVNTETGEMMGRNFRPNSVRTYTQNYGGQEHTQQYRDVTMADMTDEQAHKMCLELASVELAAERTHYSNCLARSTSGQYTKAIEKSLSELHEPRSMKR